MNQTIVKKKAVKSFVGKFNDSRILIVANPDGDSLSFANYDNNENHAPWTAFMQPEEAKRMAETILDLLK